MKHGFIRVAAASPKIRLADCSYNAKQMMDIIAGAEKEDIKLLVFPELSITGYTCGDLFFQDSLICEAKENVNQVTHFTKDKELVVVIGFPYEYEGVLYNTAAVIQAGKILGLVPKTNRLTHEARYFAQGPAISVKVDFMGEEVYFGSKLLFECMNIGDFVIEVGIGMENFASKATVIANLSASEELIGRGDYRRQFVKSESMRLISGYIYAEAGEGESTTDSVYSGHNLIAEDGIILNESEPFEYKLIYSEIDLGKIVSKRKRVTRSTYQNNSEYIKIPYSFSDKEYELKNYKLSRVISRSPFIPEDKGEREKLCKDIIMIQAMGLKGRLSHIRSSCALIGLSGGLDSTLALLVIDRTFDMMGLDKKGILAVTMPCFGTTDRTYNNALTLAKSIGATIIEIPIRDAVIQHFKDIGQDINTYDITYENSQARERTQVLMDLANMYNGLMVGPGDMSELVLGWTTYNGDHMSMYGVNSSVPKTVVRFLVEHIANTTDNKDLSLVLKDILDTPVSPELLPTNGKDISQRTEDFVGPYLLNDFFMYYILKYGFTPEKVYRLAKTAFKEKYSTEEILKWLKIFYKRFLSQQYKRSCLPDGPKISDISVSPRGSLMMPSDAKMNLWLEELDSIKP